VTQLRTLIWRLDVFWAALIAILAFLCAAPAFAHEPTIAVLELRDQGKGHYLGSWAMPPTDITLKPIFPPQCTWIQPELNCGARGLVGRLSFDGLGSKQSATMIRVIAQNGDVQTYTVSAANPFVTVATEPGTNLAVWAELANTYINIGIDHILLGIDHLLFVLGLIWLVRGRWMLVKTITSFTVAHSISLAAATFGWIGVPTAPLNAAIALSIVFVGVEIVKLNRGEVGLTARYPWVVAFSFGLLHGMGFATALINLGIPKTTLPIALLFFNVGVEIGQLLFVLLVLALMWAHRRVQATLPRWSASVPAYAIGTVATFWFLIRLPEVVAQ
jgi:hypothetical protein